MYTIDIENHISEYEMWENCVNRIYIKSYAEIVWYFHDMGLIYSSDRKDGAMIDLYELKQLIAFADLGTLTKVAEEFHVSNPSITRSMKQLEDEFGVSLFSRGKNRIELNETGKKAVEYGRKLIEDAEQTEAQVRAFDQRQRTLVVRSCAPAPLWELLRKLSMAFPGMMIESAICQNEEVEEAWKSGTCDIAILPYEFEYESGKKDRSGKCVSRKFMRERLFVCVPPDHVLADNEILKTVDVNGFNFLLRSELGFWDTMCRQKMPASKFLVQTDESTFDELVRESSLPCFTTDYFRMDMNRYGNRVNIPLADADIMFYIAAKNGIDIEKLTN